MQGRVIESIRHMLRVRDCRHICLFCEYFDRCRAEIAAEAAEKGERENSEHEICSEK